MRAWAHRRHIRPANAGIINDLLRCQERKSDRELESPERSLVSCYSTVPNFKTMVYTEYIKQRILFYFHCQGYKAPMIAKLLHEEKLTVTREGVHKFIKHYQDTGAISRKPGSGRPSKITAEIKAIVDDQMIRDDETSAYQLHQLLVSKGYDISLRTILRCRTSLGLTFRGSAYCQMIREANKAKRLQWAIDNQELEFDDVVWTDECTVQLESHRRYCFRKIGQKPRNKPR